MDQIKYHSLYTIMQYNAIRKEKNKRFQMVVLRIVD